MRRLFAILLLLSCFSFTSYAWQIKQDTLVANLKGATDFLQANNAFYIVESEAHRVIKIDDFGNILETYGNRGSGNYQFDRPFGIASSTGLKIYISDTGNNRIQVLDKRWQYLSSIKGNNHFQVNSKIEPTHLTINNFGEVIFYDRRSKSLAKYDEDGAFLDEIPLPSEVKDVSGLQAESNKIYVLDKKSGFIHRLSENGFYESFYKAEKANSFYVQNQVIYQITENGLRILNADRDFENHPLQIENATSFIVNDDGVFVLYKDKLLRLYIK